MKLSFSRVALAAALSFGTVGMVAVTATPALAAKKEKAVAGQYSKEFITVYQPLSTKIETDAASVVAAIPTLTATIKSPDEQLAGGQLLYNAGVKTSNAAVQYQGIKLMADSGKLPADSVGKVYLAAGQLGYNAKDFAAARGYLEKAVAITPNEPMIYATLAEIYVQEKNFKQALTTLDKAIALRAASGAAPIEGDAFRGLAIAANNGLTADAAIWAQRVIATNPRAEYRKEAYKVIGATSRFTKEEELDFLRLMMRSDSFSIAQQYNAYLEVADARRRPGEVQALVQKGLAAGMLKSSGSLAADELAIAKTRYDATLRELATDGKSASGAGALNIADVYLGYGKAAEAEALYRKALTSLSGVEKDRALTGLGIALSDQGKNAEAKTTFGQITTGSRAQLAKLWLAYLGTKAA